MKITQLENKNQFVLTLGAYKFYIFVSYDTPIAIIDYKNNIMIINGDKWDYSKTTLKHFYLFIEWWGVKSMRDMLDKYPNNKRKSLQYYIDNGNENLEVIDNTKMQQLYNRF